jgi:serine/threonine protein phosphatase PrpC
MSEVLKEASQSDIKSCSTAFRAYLAIEQGPRDEQQDAAGFFERNRCLLAVVCDGAGGHRGGREASQMAVETARIAFEKADGIFEDPRAALEEICREADRKIRQLGESPKLSPKSTIAMVYLDGKTAHGVHVGDSRVYRLRAGRIQERTRDHSMVQILFEQGEVSEDDMGTHPDQGRLLRALGSGEDLKVSHWVGRLAIGDAFLLCTDGFWERTKSKEIEEFFQRKPTAENLKLMVGEAVRRNGPRGDNTTALAILFGGSKRNRLLEILLIFCGFLTGAVAGAGFFIWMGDSLDLSKILSVVLEKLHL